MQTTFKLLQSPLCGGQLRNTGLEQACLNFTESSEWDELVRKSLQTGQRETELFAVAPRRTDYELKLTIAAKPDGSGQAWFECGYIDPETDRLSCDAFFECNFTGWIANDSE